MLKRLRELYRKEAFHPSIIGIFINPFYIVRKGLLNGIKSNSHNMRGVMLDFGCGSKPYEKLFKVKKYIGVDIKGGGHDHKNEPVDIFYDGRTLPFGDECFDSLFSSEVLEHISDPEKTLAELNRVLKEEGVALLTVPFVWDEHEKPFDFRRYTSFGIKDLLERHGFQIIKLEKSSTYVETIFQMWNAYLFQILNTKNAYLNVALHIVFIAPFTILGLIISKVLPKRYDFYHSNIVVARKVQ